MIIQLTKRFPWVKRYTAPKPEYPFPPRVMRMGPVSYEITPFIRIGRSLMVDHNREPLRILIVEDGAPDIGGMLGIPPARQMQIQREVMDSIRENFNKPACYAAAQWRFKHQNELFLASFVLAQAAINTGSVSQQFVPPPKE